ncbi:uncharacterized protein EV420DRAFT_1592840 [Desarmillaria tabescens]|uniref:Uncharacterized protein n=1 Tax=Armillaria tabescens TaxID=1929756 RepID=A0AA39J516_ARMTA|nr:uncharacterized protein EV420DRAFT_1592840 [Desarmillaria tabescens]KAK0435570.1 hypothetical protein EV420DRAFT_1592840 [Desarmillaria tabescens]
MFPLPATHLLIAGLQTSTSWPLPCSDVVLFVQIFRSSTLDVTLRETFPTHFYAMKHLCTIKPQDHQGHTEYSALRLTLIANKDDLFQCSIDPPLETGLPSLMQRSSRRIRS